MNGESASHGVSLPGLLAASRGFHLCFWGVGLALFMSVDAVRFRFLDGVPMPPQTLGLIAIALGVRWLRRPSAGPLRAPVRIWIPVALCAYFSPFVLWWRRVPYDPWLILNVLGLAAAGLMTMTAICRQAARTGRVLGAVGFAREARWAAILCGPVSCAGLAALAAWVGICAASRGTGLYGEWFIAIHGSPRMASMVAALPFTLTAACAWRARRVCQDAICSAGDGESLTPSA